MASIKRLEKEDFSFNAETARKSAVLALLYPVGEQAYTVFIRRNEYPGVHSGQISFPGGQQEETDASHVDTALREAWEETAIEPSSVNIIGELTHLYIPPSNFLVYPVLGFCRERPQFRPDPSEVQEIIESPLEVLLDASNKKVTSFTIPGGIKVSAPAFHLNGKILWGATAMMVSELLDMVTGPLRD